MERYLSETPLLDFSHDSIRRLTEKWKKLSQKEIITAAYNFTRDDVAVGFNPSELHKASWILEIGCGQSTTKAILLMALLRASGIPCRIHGFMAEKALYSGIASGLVYKLCPGEILHCWTEVYYNGVWYNLEGVVLDRKYITRLQSRFPQCEGAFTGYGMAVNYFQNPGIDWDENNTYIQSCAIIRDLGVFDSPDEFFERCGQVLSPFKAFFYQHLGRKQMNRRLNKMREIPKKPVYIPRNK